MLQMIPCIEQPTYTLHGMDVNMVRRGHRYEEAYTRRDTAKLPHPAQKLTITELARAHEMIEGERPENPLKDDVACDCFFWQKYCLPCRHIWLQDHIFGQVLTDEIWDKSAFSLKIAALKYTKKWGLKHILSMIFTKTLVHLQNED